MHMQSYMLTFIFFFLGISSHQVNTLVADGRHLVVGTLDGLVAIFDSETRSVYARYSWHEEKVRSLLILPEQIRPSICAEVDISSKKTAINSSQKDKLSKFSSFVVNEPNSVSHNKLCIDNKNSNGPLIASIGNGRRRMNVSKTYSAHQRPRTYTRVSEDITLLIWHS